MRLWHKDLISVLPMKQLISQWRECCCIASNIAYDGTPNHILVNKIMRYPIEHFYVYSWFVYQECIKRGYNIDWNRFKKYMNENVDPFVEYDDLFNGWHNHRYLKQCFYNLQEKFDCGGITKDEFLEVFKAVYWKL